MPVTAAQIQKILKYDTTIVDDITEQLAMASILIALVESEGGITDTAQLEKIELCLAAHFIAVTDPVLKSEKIGDASEIIESKVDIGLKVTRWGQQAIALDTSGYLEKTSNGAGTELISFSVLNP